MRWLAYSGSPILIEELLYRPEHSLIDQSLHALLGAKTTNACSDASWLTPRRRDIP